MALDLVEMEHPDLPGQTARVPKQSVRHHQRAGWRLKEPDPPTQTDETTEAPETPGLSHVQDPPPRRRRSGKEAE